jgi:pyruvate/2-oxoglutarate dehydrogenase complex dihydrolipoamide acyltransferase (E2) component
MRAQPRALMSKEERVAQGNQLEAGISDPRSRRKMWSVARLLPLDPNNLPSSESIMSGSGSATSVKSESEAKDVLALPAICNFVRKCGVDLGVDIALGSGEKGRVERKDIERHLASKKSVGEQLPVATIRAVDTHSRECPSPSRSFNSFLNSQSLNTM